MVNTVLIGFLLLSTILLAVAILIFRTLQNTQHSNNDYAQVLDREAQALRDELQRRAQEQQQLIGLLEEAQSHLGEPRGAEREQIGASEKSSEGGAQEPLHKERRETELTKAVERERQQRLEAEQRVWLLEEENKSLINAQQGLERYSQELQQSLRILEKERANQQREMQEQTKRLRQERVHLPQEQQRSKAESEGVESPPIKDASAQTGTILPWRRNLPYVAVVLAIFLAMWFTSLLVALHFLAP